MANTFFENTRVQALLNTAGTIVNTTVDGTTQGTINAYDYEYHALTYVGSVANTGTFFIYGMAAGQTSALLGSFIVGSISGANVIYEIKADALNGSLLGGTGGTLYNQLGATVKVDSGGTWRGVAAWYSKQPRTAGTTPAAIGWGSVGTTLF